MWSHTVILIYISLMINKVENFWYFMSHLDTLFCKVPVVSTHFSNGLSVYFVLIYKN